MAREGQETEEEDECITDCPLEGGLECMVQIRKAQCDCGTRAFAVNL